MLIPALFHGTTRNVMGRVRTIVKRIGRGESVKSVFDALPMVDTSDHPDSLIWIDRAWATLGEQPHFILCVFGELLFDDQRVPRDRWDAVHAEAVKYLSASDWGTLILNWTQGYLWAVGMPARKLQRAPALAIVRSTAAFWEEYLALGARFFGGGSDSKSFPDAQPLVRFILAHCGLDLRISKEMPGLLRGRRDLPALIRAAHLVERIERDDAFWERVERGDLRIA